jgi:hypothetical protein
MTDALIHVSNITATHLLLFTTADIICHAKLATQKYKIM